MAPKVYIETSVVSYLTARASRDLVVAAHQAITRQWWDETASNFELVISEFVLEEAAAGDPNAARCRLDALKSIQTIVVSDEAKALAKKLVELGPMPREYAVDALHVAVCAVNGIDFLLTWNCKHLANASLRRQIEKLIEGMGYAAPLICTPDEFLEG